jgi:hypothetical protein
MITQGEAMRALSCLLLFAACGDHSTKSTTMPVGPAGGTVSAGDGASVVIPSGALSTTVPITVSSTSVAAPDGTTAVGTPYLFGPEGTQFAQPVTVTLAFSSDLLPAGSTSSDVVVYTAPQGSTSYEALTTTLADATHVQAQTTHFSVFIAAVKAHGNPHDLAVSVPEDLSVSMPVVDASVSDDLLESPDLIPVDDGGCALVFAGSMSGPCTVSATCAGHAYQVQCQVNACGCAIDGASMGFLNAPNACAESVQMLWTLCRFP